MNLATALLFLALLLCGFLGLKYAYSSLFASYYVLIILLKCKTVANRKVLFYPHKEDLCASQQWRLCLKYFLLLAWIAQDFSNFPPPLLILHPLFLGLVPGVALGWVIPSCPLSVKTYHLYDGDLQFEPPFRFQFPISNCLLNIPTEISEQYLKFKRAKRELWILLSS